MHLACASRPVRVPSATLTIYTMAPGSSEGLRASEGLVLQGPQGEEEEEAVRAEDGCGDL